MGRLSLLGIALFGALALGLAAYRVAPADISLTAAVAVYAATLATATFLINGRSAMVDRGDLRAEITVDHWGEARADTAVLVLRLYNAGRRPVRVEEVGFWSDQSRLTHFPSWQSWEDTRARPEIPKTFTESDSLRLWTWPSSVAHWYAKHHQAHWLCVKLAHGDPLWERLPAEVDQMLAAAWPVAKEQHLAAVAAAEAKGGVDGGGQPIGPKALD